MKTVFTTVVLICIMSTIAWSKDIYVDDDNTGGAWDGTPEHPYQHIQDGINAASDMDRIYVMHGVYEENVIMDKNAELIAYWDGDQAPIITASSGDIITTTNADYQYPSGGATIRGFIIDGQNSNRYGIVSDPSHPTSILIENNEIRNIGNDGISYLGMVIVRGNSIENIGGNGIIIDMFVLMSDSTYSSEITGNIIDNVSGYGIWATTVKIKGNTITRCKEAGFASGYHNGEISGNIIENNEVGILFQEECAGISIRIVPFCDIIGGDIKYTNYIIDNTVAFRNETNATIDATYNYWGTVNPHKIDAMIENTGGGRVEFTPFISFGPPGDVSRDGTLSAYDAALILQYVVGLIDQFPATNPIGQVAQKYIAGEITIGELDRILQQLGYPSVFKLLGLENQLLQNYPNPFNPETWIPFKLAQSAPVTINIYDTKGQLIRTLHIGSKGAGVYVTKDRAAYWDGIDYFGQRVSSGIYYYTLQADTFRATRKMLIVK